MKFRFGYGTIISLILALLVGGFFLYRHHRATQPPKRLNYVQPGGPNGIAPVPEFLLKHRDALALTPVQVQRINKLSQAYRQDIAPVKKKSDLAEATYQKYMERQGRGSRLNVQEMETQGAEIRRLSSIMSTTRHIYWQQARAMLNEKQQQTLTRLMQHVSIKDLG